LAKGKEKGKKKRKIKFVTVYLKM